MTKRVSEKMTSAQTSAPRSRERRASRRSSGGRHRHKTQAVWAQPTTVKWWRTMDFHTLMIVNGW